MICLPFNKSENWYTSTAKRDLLSYTPHWRLVDRHQRFVETLLPPFLEARTWKRHVPPKCWQSPTRCHNPENRSTNHHHRKKRKKTWPPPKIWLSDPHNKPTVRKRIYKKFLKNTSISKPLELTIYVTYTGCPRRNGQNFGRVFLMLKYTDITQNTYVQSW